MLSCKDFVAQQNQRIDGQNLSIWQRFSLKLHAFICIHCRRYLQQLHLVNELDLHFTDAQVSDKKVEECLCHLTKQQSDEEK